MADEISVNFGVQYSPSVPGISGVTFSEEEFLFDMNGKLYESGMALIQIGEEEIEPDRDVDPIGFVYIKNVGENDCIVGRLGESTVLIKPGEFCFFRANGPLFARTSQQTTYIEYILFED